MAGEDDGSLSPFAGAAAAAPAAADRELASLAPVPPPVPEVLDRVLLVLLLPRFFLGMVVRGLRDSRGAERGAMPWS